MLAFDVVIFEEEDESPFVGLLGRPRGEDDEDRSEPKADSGHGEDHAQTRAELLLGLLFVATGTYLSAVFLVSEARRADTPDLERYFVKRSLAAALAAGALAAAGLITLHADARFVFDGLKGDALPLVIVSIACGIAVLFLLQRGIRRGARGLAVVAVVAVIWAWGIAQHPYLFPQVLTIDAAAAPGTWRFCSRLSSATSSRRPNGPPTTATPVAVLAEPPDTGTYGINLAFDHERSAQGYRLDGEAPRRIPSELLATAKRL